MNHSLKQSIKITLNKTWLEQIYLLDHNHIQEKVGIKNKKLLLRKTKQKCVMAKDQGSFILNKITYIHTYITYIIY